MEKTVGNLEGIRTRLIGAQAPVCVIEDTSLDTTSDALNGVIAAAPAFTRSRAMLRSGYI